LHEAGRCIGRRLHVAEYQLQGRRFGRQGFTKLASSGHGFSIPLEQFLTLNQAHGDDIFVIKPYGDYYSSREHLNYDAIVTNRTNLAICIKTADCVPIFLVDRIKKVIAVVHAGWRSTALGITAKVIRLLIDKYHCLPRDILAVIGPAIGKCCFDLDAAAADDFRKQKTMILLYSPANDKINTQSIWLKPTAVKL